MRRLNKDLGSKNPYARMNAVRQLLQIAKDDKSLRQDVLRNLCYYIRLTTNCREYRERHKEHPSAEIQEILTLLFMEEHDVFEDCSINLQGSYLNGADLSLARLKRANLRWAQLQRADLRYAQLQGANLRYARLQRAKLSKTELQRARLWEAQMQGADLKHAQLQEAILKEAQLQRATLWQARSQEADFSGARMQGADLRQARLQSANFMDAQLQGANLRYAQLQVADLSNAQLQGAFLGEAQLQEAILMDAQLQGVSSQAYPPPPTGFESRIESRIGKPSDLTGIIFAGGLQEEDLDTLCEDLSDDQAQALRETLRLHVGKPVSRELPENSGAATGAYTQGEAKQWIAEYNKAMEEAPKEDDTANANSAPDSGKGKGD